MLLLKILGALLAVAFGVWLGLPGRYERDEDELAEKLGEGGSTARAKRHFTPMAYFARKLKPQPRAKGSRFRLADPAKKDGA